MRGTTCYITRASCPEEHTPGMGVYQDVIQHVRPLEPNGHAAVRSVPDMVLLLKSGHFSIR